MLAFENVINIKIINVMLETMHLPGESTGVGCHCLLRTMTVYILVIKK